ncbi:hypothetical protein [Mammaliicoccus sciuri]|uniref:hypothetical protein n=1 Tax=Mammaliicoccus sciuri TaxID=1296 RepID=UPI0019526653|nr:hypothetical protein [Mammaliicoccus sciuri]MCJ0965556.1 hypothetical protein [Mammaliicoccus sciuri]MCJ1776331.1 hypothetical protein [Mammaliicoccus sciuri]MEB7733468.1 hypothetical protein [Mammaliicoccus sciuri]
MKVQVKIIKTAIGWLNIRSSETDELLLNAPLETIQKLIPNFSENTSLATAELSMSAIMEVQHG